MITGEATGIGFALAEKFLAMRNHIIAVGRNEATLRKAKQFLPQITICVADVALPADRKRLVSLFSDVTILSTTQIFRFASLLRTHC